MNAIFMSNMIRRLQLEVMSRSTKSGNEIGCAFDCITRKVYRDFQLTVESSIVIVLVLPYFALWLVN